MRHYVLTIKRKNHAEWFIWVLILLPFFFGLLNGFLGLPWAIRYSMDVAWVWLVVIMLRHKGSLQGKGVTGLLVWIVLFLIYTLLVYLVQYQSGLYYLWGFRNNFRRYAAFFAFVAFLKPRDVEDYFSFFDKLFWVNVIVSIYQFIVLEVNQDFLGGIFGIENGVNGYTNIYFVIIITRAVVRYMEKRESAKTCFSKCIVALLVAALAELKFFFVEIILIIVLAILFTNFTWRKFIIVAGGVAAVFSFAALLSLIFPIFSDFLSMEFFWETATSDKGYTSSGDLNRLTAIPRINELWLKNWPQRLFGLGLGNCDTSSFAIVNTPFYEQYGHMHYTWMTYAMTYLETGYVGLIFYFGFFVLVYLGIEKIERRSEGVVKSNCRTAKIVAILCIIISVYNSSMRHEAAYMAYFVLAIPFALDRCNVRKKHYRQNRKAAVPVELNT